MTTEMALGGLARSPPRFYALVDGARIQNRNGKMLIKH
jgi:hypothetical protein